MKSGKVKLELLCKFS